MSLVHSVRNALARPSLLGEYLCYCANRISHGGQAVRVIEGGTRIANFSGFSEYRSLFAYGREGESAFFQRFPFGDGDFIDVGANIGVVTLPLSTRYGDRRVHAFEPNPAAYRALLSNVALNGATNVVAHAAAVADSTGEVSFSADETDRATGALSEGNGKGTISVPAVSLDSYVEEHAVAQVALLKVDVEGHETRVFEGARNSLGRKLFDVIFYEVCPPLTKAAGFTPEQATQLLMDYGYRINRFDERGRLVAADLEALNHLILDNWVATRE